jgi:hypothetical protein
MNILDPQGPIAAANKTILIDSIAIMLAIVVCTENLIRVADVMESPRLAE